MGAARREVTQALRNRRHSSQGIGGSLMRLSQVAHTARNPAQGPEQKVNKLTPSKAQGYVVPICGVPVGQSANSS